MQFVLLIINYNSPLKTFDDFEMKETFLFLFIRYVVIFVASVVKANTGTIYNTSNRNDVANGIFLSRYFSPSYISCYHKCNRNCDCQRVKYNKETKQCDLYKQTENESEKKNYVIQREVCNCIAIHEDNSLAILCCNKVKPCFILTSIANCVHGKCSKKR